MDLNSKLTMSNPNLDGWRLKPRLHKQNLPPQVEEQKQNRTPQVNAQRLTSTFVDCDRHRNLQIVTS
jgi:hypothetical protein